ncbi:MAG TPA: type 2 lanthipeptide synthetase LanM family protein [Thermoanaerobaculia bacterium]|nr:type 2 lanthipeptide synthetase LanM family protein [Thermoanaerobaculia bacterium]
MSKADGSIGSDGSLATPASVPAVAAPVAPRASALDEIAARAATLWERVALAREGLLAVPPQEHVPQLLSRWARVSMGGDLEALLRRLSWDAIDPAHAAAALLPAPADGAAAAAPWLSEIEHYERLLSEEDRGRGRAPGADRIAAAAAELPFGELWLPWARRAAEQLAPVLEAHRTHVAVSAGEDLVEILLREVAHLSEPAALERFEERRQAGGAAGALASFLSDCRHDPLSELYLRYPVLARQTSRVLAQWLAWSSELLERLRADREALDQSFAVDDVEGGLGALVGVRSGLSDRHHDGRRVLALRFGSGRRLAYKPRSIGPETALRAVLDWCLVQGLEPAPYAPRTLPRAGYGWVEWIESEELVDDDEARGYYRRSGVLVAIAFALRGEDLHGENLVATRRGPVVVDPEVLLQPQRERMTTGEGEHAADASRTTCLATGLLTALQPDGREIRELGGLRAPRERRVERRLWSGVGTDEMSCRTAPTPAEPLPSVPFLRGEPVAAESHASELREGFERGYRFLLDRRTAFLSPDGPLSALHDTPVRVLFRSSQEYGRVVALMGLPRNQRSGIAGSFLMEAMLGAFQAHAERPATWPLVRAERAAMEARDIPWFSIAAGERSLDAAGEKMEGLFARSGLDAVADTLRALSESDLVDQAELVRATLEPPRSEGTWTEIVAAAPEGDGTATGRWRGVAASIGSLLRARPRGLQSRLGRWDLYAGRPGWALFLAALGRTELEGSELSRAEALRHCFGEDGAGPPAATLDALPVGGFSGLGGLAWSLVWLADLLQAPELLAQARTVADRIDDTRIAADRGFDLERGVAGAAMGLLAVAEACGDASYRDTARRCGDHLLAHQVTTGSAGAGWPNAAGLAQTGLMHGASGIARALLALAHATSEERYAIAAVAAIGHERALYEPRLRNWPVLTVDTDGRHRGRSWRISCCRGAPGIALTRLLLPAALRDPAAEAETQAALDTTSVGAGGRLHTLCCGSFGRSSVLLTAAVRGGGERRLVEAARVVEEGLAAAAGEGGFVLGLDAYANRLVHPGLLHGISGIGYHLLRLTGDFDLPDVLALELPGEHASRGAES